MAEMLTPLHWGGDRPPEGSAAGHPTAFCWPSPPFAAYPQVQPQTEALACTITGLNDKLMDGQLSALHPDQGAALVQLPHPTTCFARATVGMLITHSLLFFNVPNVWLRSLMMQPTIGGSNSIIRCHDIVMMFGQGLPAVLTSTTGPGSSRV